MEQITAASSSLFVHIMLQVCLWCDTVRYYKFVNTFCVVMWRRSDHLLLSDTLCDSDDRRTDCAIIRITAELLMWLRQKSVAHSSFAGIFISCLSSVVEERQQNNICIASRFILFLVFRAAKNRVFFVLDVDQCGSCARSWFLVSV